MEITTEISFDENWLYRVYDNLFDDRTMLEFHQEYARLLSPYVPYDEGYLNELQRVITPKYIDYQADYAHYMYEGIVYAPNIPEYQDGIIVGWRSPAGKGSKYPTERRIQYNKEKHKLATDHWDKAYLAEHKDELVAHLQNILNRIIKERYNNNGG